MADSQSAGNWCLIESDPGVFTELIKEFGVKGVQVEELYCLGAEHFEHLKPIHGLIFLFKWVKDDEPTGSVVQDSRLEKIFFAKQVINNACATQAILSILLNCKHTDLVLGPTLSEFKDFSSSFDANMKGLTLSNSQPIRSCHNSFARTTLFEVESKLASKDDDVYHFVSYLPIDGRLYELDGLKDGPIDLGAVSPDADWLDVVRPVIEKRMKRTTLFEVESKLASKDDDVYHFVSYLPIDGRLYELDGLKDGPIDLGAVSPDADWLDVVRPVIEKRMKRYSEGEIHFNLMAIVSDRKMIYERKTIEIQKQIEESGMDTDVHQAEIAKLKLLIQDEENKSKRYQDENVRRKHNYLPLIVEILKILAKKGKLVSMYEKAKERAIEKDAKREEAKA
uniref:Ubiquitin carboxyl-terminal hydrolase n=1 Tax=Timema cristinae TaxID=61476 RepID=A0A7R9CNP0_TIMCR|nr:unnamed protein product [Timema cristinae]